MVGFNSSYDGTYNWTIDSKNILKISNLTGETIETLNWNTDKDAENIWYLQDNLVIGKHVNKNTDGKEITEDDISPDFLENNTNLLCTVFYTGNTDEEIEKKYAELAKYPDIQRGSKRIAIHFY